VPSLCSTKGHTRTKNTGGGGGFLRAFTYLAEWCRDNRERSSSFFRLPRDAELSGAAEGKPERWQIKTIDTGRFVNFRWRKVIFTAMPVMSSEKDLFRLATRVLETASMPLMVLLSRYERSGLFAQVLSVDIPFEVMKAFVISQKRQNEIEANREAGIDGCDGKSAAQMIKEEQEHVKSMWSQNGMSQELYRRFAMQLLNLRSQGMDNGADEPPLVMLHSRKDDRHMVLWFRDYHLLIPHFQNSIMTLGQPPDVEYTFVDWPIVDHSPNQDRPQIMCENPKCGKSEGPSTDSSIMKTYERHKGPRDREVIILFKKRMTEIWRETFQPRIDKEMEQFSADRPDASGEDKQLILEGLVEKYETEAAQLQETLEKQILANTRTKLNKCGRCRMVAYCSTPCQKEDWLRHKTVCFSEK